MIEVKESVPLWGPAFIIKAKEDEKRRKAKQSNNYKRSETRQPSYWAQVVSNGMLEDLVDSGDASEIVSYLKTKRVGSFSSESLDPCLMQAIRIGDRSVIEGLICHGADVNYDDDVDFGDNTPLTMCIQRGNVEIARLLLNNEAEPDYCKPISGESALMMAVKSCRAQSFVALLLEWQELLMINRMDKRGETALHLALRLKKNRIARMLLENGSDVDMKKGNKKSARDLATQLGLCDALGIMPSTGGLFTKQKAAPDATTSLSDITNLSAPSVTNTDFGDMESESEDEEENMTE